MRKRRVARIADVPFEKWYVASDKGCWEWAFSRNSKGVGYLMLDGKQIRAPRASFEMHVRKLKRGEQINHHCDNPSCIRPDHLYAGNQKQNVADIWRRGRGNPARGEAQAVAKLDDAAVAFIRDNYVPYGKWNMHTLAKKYGVNPVTIFSVVHRESWRHVA